MSVINLADGGANERELATMVGNNIHIAEFYYFPTLFSDASSCAYLK